MGLACITHDDKNGYRADSSATSVNGMGEYAVDDEMTLCIGLPV